MGDLRDTPHFAFKVEMDKAIGSAVKSMGPRLVLTAIPLGITGDKYVYWSFNYLTFDFCAKLNSYCALLLMFVPNE